MKFWLIASVAVLLSIVTPCAAQVVTSGSAMDRPPPAVGNDRDAGVNELKQFGTYDTFKARLRHANKEKKPIEELLAQDKAEALSLVGAMKLSCVVTDAVLVAVDDAAHTKTYEVACTDGVGYFLVQGETPAQSSGFSCFAAEASHQADIAAHREASPLCSLPQNVGTEAAALTILANAGKVCVLKQAQWRGQSPASRTDYLETSCADGTGYMVATPLPGSLSPLRVDDCRASARKGVPCRLSDNGISMQTFKDALTRRGANCDVKDMRLIGREKIKHRHVVEFLCPSQQPNGLVAFIPLDASPEPFETLDCPTAAKQGIVCTLTKSR